MATMMAMIATVLDDLAEFVAEVAVDCADARRPCSVVMADESCGTVWAWRGNSMAVGSVTSEKVLSEEAADTSTAVPLMSPVMWKVYVPAAVGRRGESNSP